MCPGDSECADWHTVRRLRLSARQLRRDVSQEWHYDYRVHKPTVTGTIVEELGDEDLDCHRHPQQRRTAQSGEGDDPLRYGYQSSQPKALVGTAGPPQATTVHPRSRPPREEECGNGQQRSPKVIVP